VRGINDGKSRNRKPFLPAKGFPVPAGDQGMLPLLIILLNTCPAVLRASSLCYNNFSIYKYFMEMSEYGEKVCSGAYSGFGTGCGRV
jgi:hypothetical protein